VKKKNGVKLTEGKNGRRRRNGRKWMIIYRYMDKYTCLYLFLYIYGDGDWGLGIGDWGLGPIPNPQSPIPNPQLE